MGDFATFTDSISTHRTGVRRRITHARWRLDSALRLARARRRHRRRRLRPGTTGRIIRTSVALGLVAGGLALLQGGNGGVNPQSRAAEPAEPVAQPPSSAGRGEVAAEFVRGPRFSLALPTGWERTKAAPGATFSAVAPDGSADATLWITKERRRGFGALIARSQDELRSLGASPYVCERALGPTPQTTRVALCSDPVEGGPVLGAALRAAGPYSYHLATSIAPDASEEAAEGLALLAGSLVPEPRTGR